MLGAAFDVILAPLAMPAYARSRDHRASAAKRVLIVEIWGIGDAVIASAAAAAIRHSAPGTQITVLAHPTAAPLFEQSDVVDDVIAFEFPWTSSTRKYSPSRYDLRVLHRIVRELRARQFDVSLDARMDPRSNLLTFLCGARRRFGFAHGAGTWLLTDRIAAGNPMRHRVDDWLALADAVGFRETAAPTLALNPAERDAAQLWLDEHGLDADRLLVGVHPGASSATKRWDLSGFAAVADAIADTHSAQLLVFADPSGYGQEISVRAVHRVVQPSLRELMALVRHCDLFICNDSGPMHIANALGIPVVAVFTSSEPAWFAPRGPRDRIVIQGGFSCRPCFDRCVLAQPYCNTTITAAQVIAAATQQLDDVAPASR